MNKQAVILISLLLVSPIFAAADQVMIVPRSIGQGKTLEIRLNQAAAGVKISGTFIGQKIGFFQGDDYYRGFVGIPLEQKPGKYPLNLTIDGSDGSKKTIKKTVIIAKGKFPVVSFWLKPAKNKLRSRELINNEWADVEKVLVVKEPVQRWRGKFSMPVEGETSMVFGVIQRVNGKPSGRHRGYDIAVPQGTTVYAPNAGKVVYTGRLKAFGNTIVVDHGLGVQTLYFHLSKFLVEVGQLVSRGDKLALSGNTGISSGAHLHWGMSVNNLRVDPIQWVKMEM
ncbi:MAG: M23 family metallopeptidase [Candidatus Margulisbacteria bacterium]|nr:M23 family metallopeptidase [Candidatus Margulisiibacteriota bacterium]